MRSTTAVSELADRGVAAADRAVLADWVAPAVPAGSPAGGRQRNQGSRSSLGVAGVVAAG